MTRQQLILQLTIANALTLLITGCPKSQETRPPIATSKPVTTSVDEAATQSVPGKPPADAGVSDRLVEVRIHTLADPQQGWLRIEAMREGAPGAWATGELMSDNKIVIETENVKQFSIMLTHLKINWGHRVILRINGTSSELAHKDRRSIHLRRSPAGSWDPVERND